MESEIKQIFIKQQEAFERRFPLVANAYNNEYGWPELDTLRHEACLCIAFNLNQAAITLCNHLLESLLKYSLIYSYSINNEPSKLPPSNEIVKAVVGHTKEGINKYGGMALNQTINGAFSAGLIDDNEKNKLHEFRRIFRNAYSHADKKKTFGDMLVPVQGARIEKNKIETNIPVETAIAEIPIIHSIVQAMKAGEDAPNYFLYLDGLVRRMKKRVFPNG